jgi:hypothetical protein
MGVHRSTYHEGPVAGGVSSGCPEEDLPTDLDEPGQGPTQTGRPEARATACGRALRPGLVAPVGRAYCRSGAVRSPARGRATARPAPLLRELLLRELSHEAGCDWEVNHGDLL